MRKLIYISFLVITFIACETERQKVSVKYEISNASSQTDISYRISNGDIINESIEFQSGEDIWKYNFSTQRGEIVYLSAKYSDSTSSVNVLILVDGKVYKQGSSVNEPDKYITVSGTIPY